MAPMGKGRLETASRGLQGGFKPFSRRLQGAFKLQGGSKRLLEGAGGIGVLGIEAICYICKNLTTSIKISWPNTFVRKAICYICNHINTSVTISWPTSFLRIDIHSKINTSIKISWPTSSVRKAICYICKISILVSKFPGH